MINIQDFISFENFLFVSLLGLLLFLTIFMFLVREQLSKKASIMLIIILCFCCLASMFIAFKTKNSIYKKIDITKQFITQKGISSNEIHKHNEEYIKFLREQGGNSFYPTIIIKTIAFFNYIGFDSWAAFNKYPNLFNSFILIIYLFIFIVSGLILFFLITFMFSSSFELKLRYQIFQRIFLSAFILIGLQGLLVFLFYDTKVAVLFLILFLPTVILLFLNVNEVLVIIFGCCNILFNSYLLYRVLGSYYPKLIFKQYAKCPLCGKTIKIMEDWQCEDNGHFQGKERYVTAKCIRCRDRLKSVFCEHCHGEIKL